MRTPSISGIASFARRWRSNAALVAGSVALVVLSADGAAAQARSRYERALDQVQALRLDGPKPSPLSHMRRSVAACESIARRYPASGYADNALWQAATVALAAFRVYGSDVDRAQGERLLARLVSGYPASSLRPKAASLLRTTRAASPKAPAARTAKALPARPTTAAPPRPAPASDVSESEDPPATPGVADPPPAPAAPLATLRRVTRERLDDVVRVVLEFDGEVSFRRDELAGPARLYFDFDRLETPPDLKDAVLRFDGPAGRQIRLGRPKAETTRLVIDLEGSTGYTVRALGNPYRLAIDLRHSPAAPPLLVARQTPAATALLPAAPAGRAIAAAMAPPERLVPRPLPHPLADRPVRPAVPVAARAVAAALAPPPLLTAHALRIPARIRLVRAPAGGPSSAEIERRLAQDLATQRPVLAATPAMASVAPAVPPVPSAPSQNGRGGYSLARQLGLGVSRIVIDPGHGGHDPGVAGGRHTTESEVVLDIALRLEKLLKHEPGVEVVMTRRTDVFIPLEERTAMANRAGADLFLSIHANSSRNRQASGVETYFLDFANNPEAEEVAALENATAVQSMHQLPDMIKTIALNNKVDESRDFARRVQETMVSRLSAHNEQLRDRGVKQAPFVVLIGAGMPSVLAEIAFLSHQGENGLLRTEKYRQRIADALFEAVVTYQRSLKGVGTVASH